MSAGCPTASQRGAVRRLMPTNYTPATAIAIAAFPYTLTVDLTASPDQADYVPAGAVNIPVKNTGWWRYVAQAGDVALSMSAIYADPAVGSVPMVSLWVADPTLPDLTQAIDEQGAALNQVTVRNVLPNPYDSAYVGYWLLWPVTTGRIYYLQVAEDSDPYVAPTTPIALTVCRAPQSVVPAGSLLITDDTAPYPAVAIGATGAVLRVIGALPHSERGDTLASGAIAIVNDAGVEVFTGQLVSVGTAPVTAPSVVRAHPRGDWFVAGVPLAGPTIATVTTAATVGAVTWLLAASGTVGELAVNPAATIAYWVDGARTAVHRHNLVTDLPMADFLTAVGGALFGVEGDDTCLPDGSVLVRVTPAAAPAEIRRYSAAAALLRTYAVVETGFLTLDRFRLEPAGTHFWVWLHSTGSDPLTGRWKRIQVSDGSATVPFDLPLFNESGLGPVEGYPFAPSNSCPLLFLAAPMPNPPVHEAIRFVRRFPFPSDKQLRLFLQRLEFTFQRGVGLATGQGDDPQAMLRISRDGGMTWGPERFLTMGAMGEYVTRMFTTRLGQFRNGVIEIAVSDPVIVAFLDCLADVEEGSS